VEVVPFGNQRSVGKPEAVSSAELTVNGGDFQLDLPGVMPGPLHSRATSHFVSAKQSSRFIPLAADAMEQVVLIWFFGGKCSVLVPGPGNTMPVTVPHGHLLTELSVPIKGLLDGGVHDTRIRFHGPTPRLASFNTRELEKPTRVLTENRRGANPTRPHERYREAPLREARRAAPDWARASAALSSIENSRFSRGTKPLRRKSYWFVVMSLPVQK
jgi:hypothetical protein